LGTAYVAGFRWAIERGYDYVFEMDCVFSHHPRYLPVFLAKIEQADLVIGSRYVEGGGTANWRLVRRMIR
jgi:dolichol-phosphate mannosyltransferase